jgi:hypothetical protein
MCESFSNFFVYVVDGVDVAAVFVDVVVAVFVVVVAAAVVCVAACVGMGGEEHILG